MRYRSLVVGCSAVALVLCAAVPAAATPIVFVPFATLPATAHPVAFAADEAGTLYTANADDSVSAVTTAGSVTARYATLASGANVCAMVADRSDELWTSDLGTRTVSRINYGGVVTSFALTGTLRPCALTTVGRDLFLADELTGVISRVSSAGTVTSVFATLPSTARPVALTSDAAGNLYTANAGDDSVSKISPAGLVTPGFASLAPVSGTASPSAITIDRTNTLYVANSASDVVVQVSPLGAVTTVARLPEFAKPNAIRVDNGGDVLVSASGIGAIVIIPASTSRAEPLVSLPRGHVLAGFATTLTGNVWTADSSTNDITFVRLQPLITSPALTATSFTGTPVHETVVAAGLDPISFTTDSTKLPPGLSLDSSSGELTGVPTLPGTYVFDVKATNTAGSTVQRENIRVLPGLRIPPIF